jgi:hypothetical protein
LLEVVAVTDVVGPPIDVVMTLVLVVVLVLELVTMVVLDVVVELLADVVDDEPWYVNGLAYSSTLA